jgi:hypothetical protein
VADVSRKRPLDLPDSDLASSKKIKVNNGVYAHHVDADREEIHRNSIGNVEPPASIVPAPIVGPASIVPAPIVGPASIVPAPIVGPASIVPAPIVGAASIAPAPIVGAASFDPAPIHPAYPIPSLQSGDNGDAVTFVTPNKDGALQDDALQDDALQDDACFIRCCLYPLGSSCSGVQKPVAHGEFDPRQTSKIECSHLSLN